MQADEHALKLKQISVAWISLMTAVRRSALRRAASSEGWFLEHRTVARS